MSWSFGGGEPLLAERDHMRTTCPSCAADFAVKPELAGRRVQCPKCKQPVRIPSGEAEAGENNGSAESTGSSNWLILGAVLLISLTVGVAGGFVFGHQKGKATNAQEAAEAQTRASNAERALTERDAELAKVRSDQAKDSEQSQTKIAALQKAEQTTLQEIERFKEVERRQAALKREQDEKTQVIKKEQETAKKRELATPKDGTQDFARIKDFYEKHIGQHYFIKGLFYPAGLSRDRDRKCYSVRFANSSGAVDGGPQRDRLSFVASEAMGEKLLDVKGASQDVIVYVVIGYLDEPNKAYPVDYITKIEFVQLDLDVVKEYVAVTLTVQRGFR